MTVSNPTLSFLLYREWKHFDESDKNFPLFMIHKLLRRKQGVFRMEKYTELELLLDKAKGGDQAAILALNEVMEQLNQFQSEV